MRPPAHTQVRSFVSAAIRVCAVTAGVDQLAAPGASALTAIQATGLGVVCGAVVGLPWGGISVLMSRLSPRTAALVLTTVGLLSGFSVAQAIGALDKLGGPHALLAISALVGFSIAGAALGALAAWSIVRDEEERPGPRSTKLRVAGGTALVLGFVAATTGEASMPSLAAYPPAHVAVRVMALTALAIALVWLGPQRPAGPRWLHRVALPAVAALLAFVPLSSLSSKTRGQRTALASRPYSGLALASAQALTDFDGDDYSSLFGGGDCEGFNSAVHPRAIEIPGNGLDDNCVGGDGRRARIGPRARLDDLPSAPRPSPTSVILVTVDSLRPDHMGMYGYDRATTPNLDRWAAESTRFDRAYSAAGWTSMAMTSLFRGLYPRRLRWSRIYESTHWKLYRAPNPPDLAADEEMHAGFVLPLDDENPTLPEILQRRGMTTAAVVDDGISEFLSPQFGTDRGFDRFVDIDELPNEDRNDRGTVDESLAVLRTLADDDAPFFLWVHLYGPHFPDERHDDAPLFGGFENQRDRYDHEIAFMDMQAGRLLEAADAAARDRSIAVFVLADHGEHLFSTGRLHGVDLHERTIRVPLLVRAPGWSSRSADAPVHMVDLVPTILDMTDTPGPPLLDGRDLGPLGRGETFPSRILLSELWRFDARGNPTIDQVAAYDGEYKLIVDLMAQTMLLSDAADPGEPPRNLIDRRQPGALLDAVYTYLDEAGDGVSYGEP